MTHINLLNAYASDRNAESFARIIQEYQQFVFATCRRKLHDPADVDDAVQETFLRLAQKAGELHSNVGGWLHRCAANVSVDLNRRRSKRKEHESAAAAARKEGAADAQQQLAELREHLDLALNKLDEDQRELIIQRYFVGRPQVEIAEELGVAASTITHRLDRAIDALRAHLQSLGGGALSATGAAGVTELIKAEIASSVVPQALTANLMKIGLSGVSASAATATGTALTGAVVAKIALATVACAVLLVGGIWAISGGVKIPPQTIVIAQGPAPAPLIAPATAPSSAPAFTVRDPSREPVEAQPPRWETTQPAVPAAILSGRITDRDGKAVTSGTITLSGPMSVRAPIGTDGVYTVGTISRDGEYRVGVQAPGFLTVEPYASSTPSIQLKRDSIARRDIVLERGVPVTVTVTGPDGNPIQRAGVDLNLRGDDRNRNSPQRVSTNREGIATFTLPASKNAYVLAVSMEGYAPFHTEVAPVAVEQPIEQKVQLEPGLAVTGIAMCSDGQPATGWEIEAKPDWWASNYWPGGAKIDAEGKFILTDIAPGLYTLWVSIPEGDGGSTSRQLSVVTLPPATEPLKLTIPYPSPASRVTVAGRVKYVGGPKPDRVEVQLSGTGGAGEFRMTQIGRDMSSRTRGAAADEDTFTFENVPKGSYSLRFDGRGVESKNLAVVIPGEIPPVELKVIDATKLSGTVVDETTNQPISHYAVRVQKLRTLGNGANYVQDARWIQVNVSDGRFSVDLVGAGVYRAQVAAEGYAWAWSPETSITQGTSDIVIKVGAGGALSGQVVDFGGQPVAGAKVIPLSMAKSISMGYETRFEGDAGAVTSDEQGNFTLPHLSAGSETLKVVHPNYAYTIAKDFTIKAGDTTFAGAIHLTSGGTVEGTVYDAQGNPAAGQTLQFQVSYGYGGGGDETAGRIASVTTDVLGHYRVEHLPQMTLWVNATDRWSHQGVARRVVRPMEGKIARVDFGGTVPLTGRIVNPNSKGPQRVVVASGSADFGPMIAVGTTDDDGKFTFRGIPLGPYTLFQAAPGNRSNWIKVRDVTITDQPQDLGDLSIVAADVVVKIVPEDPNYLKNIQAVMINRDQATRLYGDEVGRADVDGAARDVWRAKGVPAGKLVALAYNPSAGNMSYYARFEHTGAESQVTLKIPSASATLRPIFPQNATDAITLANDDRSIVISVSRVDSSPTELKVPPGTYRLYDWRTGQIIPGASLVEMKAGATTEFTIPQTSQLTRPEKISIYLSIWDSNGLLIPGAAPKLIDVDGVVTDASEATSLGAGYIVKPGHYRAVLERAGKPPIEREFDAAAPTSNDRLSGITNLVMD
jgi:RNA polymerase sigma factor (sigma-70 family)